MSMTEKAAAAWRPLPEWVRHLAAEADAGGQKAAGVKIGYGSSTVSQIISNSYPGNLARVEAAVRAALMRGAVDCPVLREIPADECVRHQSAPFMVGSPVRVQLYRACRANCPHSSIEKEPRK